MNTNIIPLKESSRSVRTENTENELKLSEEWSKIEGDLNENMRMIAMRLQKDGVIPRKLGITSALRGEGVTSICIGLGVTLAHDYEARTCIVDLNWYSPSKLYLSNPDCLGVADVIFNGATLKEVIRPTGINNLYVLPAGMLEASKYPVAARSKVLGEMIQKLEGFFDHIILDLPAVLTTSDTVHLAALGEGCCVVIRQGVTPTHDIKMALDDIGHLPVLGVVLNRVKLHTPDRIVKLLSE